MPYLIIEHSANLADAIKATDLPTILHYALGAHNLFKLDDVKTNVRVADNYLVADSGLNGSFVHATLYIKQGRTPEQRGDVSKALLQLMLGHLKAGDQISVDVREFETDIYQKFVR